ncbi:MAG: NUDIX hydrolase family protein [Actinomycetia bacterium]|nr:NUDIX hydrolase family protein [Actinomycetes bacterium]
MSTVRTPDPVPGWLTEEELAAARRKLPMVYVQAIPVILDPLGNVLEVGLLLRPNEDGEMVRSFVSGRVHYRETIRAALLRHLEKDLGPLAMPQLPASLTPFTVAEYFPSPSQSGLTDERQHSVALCYVIPVQGDCEPRQDALQLTWFTPEEAMDAQVQAEFEGGGGDLVHRALAHMGWGRC